METVSAYRETEYSAGFASRTGRGRRHNEDDYTIFTTKEVGGFGEKTVQTVVIADGSGGGARGKVASRLAVQTLYQLVINNETAPIQQRFIQAVHEANGAIFRQAMLEPQLANMRSAIIAASVTSGVLHIARVGDSQAYVIRGGMAHRVTTNHTARPPIDMSYIKNGDAPTIEWNAGDGLLGSSDQIEVNSGLLDIGQANFAPGQARQTSSLDFIQLMEDDTLLLCTRSAADVLNEAQIALAVTQFPAQDAVNHLVEIVVQSGTKEDVTAVILQRQRSNALVPVVPMRHFTMPSMPVFRSMPRSVMFGAAAVAASILVVALLWFVVGNLLDGSVAAAQQPPAGDSVALAANTASDGVALAMVATATATKTPTTEPTATPEPTNTPTEAATDTPTVASTATETATAMPTETPVPTATPVPPPTRRPVAVAPAQSNTAQSNTTQVVQKPAAPIDQWWNGQTVAHLEPSEGQRLLNLGTFTWTPLNAPLPEGYAYEPVFWHRGEDAMVNGLGWAGVTRNTSISFNFDNLGVQPGEYNWGVLLVKTVPGYQRMALLSQKRLVGFERK